jgi:hypothetical protein
METKTAKPEIRISENSKEAHRAALLSKALGKKATPVGDSASEIEKNKVKEMIKKIQTEAVTVQPGIKGTDLKRINKEAKKAPKPEAPTAVNPLEALMANPDALAALLKLAVSNKTEAKVKEAKVKEVKEAKFTRMAAVATAIKDNPKETKDSLLEIADKLYMSKNTGATPNRKETLFCYGYAKEVLKIYGLYNNPIE